MNVFHYDSETGVYLGTSAADESPLEPGAFLIPAFATTDVPPAATEGHIIRFVDGAWQSSPIVEPEEPPAPAITALDVDLERDRRIDAGFVFAGIEYQTRPEDRENISGAATAALGAMMSGAEPGDYRWHGEETDFAWIAADNSIHVMDAQTMFGFGQAAMVHKSRHIFAARELKTIDPIPADFAEDIYWP